MRGRGVAKPNSATRLRLYGRMQRAVLTVIGLTCLVAASVSAAPAPPDVVVVHAPKPATLVSTYPVNGSSVPGGALIMKLVFDQAMVAQGWSYTPSNTGQFPSCLARPRLLADGRTFVLLCSLAVNGHYALQINAAPEFESAGGRRPPPVVLNFTTTDTPTLGLHDALLAAGLSDADDPIMGEKPGGSAVLSSEKPNGDRQK